MEISRAHSFMGSFGCLTGCKQLVMVCLQIIPIDDRGKLQEAFDVRIDELEVLDLKFLHGCEQPTLAVLYQDNRSERHIKTYLVDARPTVKASLTTLPNLQAVSALPCCNDFMEKLTVKAYQSLYSRSQTDWLFWQILHREFLTSFGNITYRSQELWRGKSWRQRDAQVFCTTMRLQDWSHIWKHPFTFSLAHLIEGKPFSCDGETSRGNDQYVLIELILEAILCLPCKLLHMYWRLRYLLSTYTFTLCRISRRVPGSTWTWTRGPTWLLQSQALLVARLFWENLSSPTSIKDNWRRSHCNMTWSRQAFNPAQSCSAQSPVKSFATVL